MTPLPPTLAYGVWLTDRRVGTLRQRGDYTWFLTDEAYRQDPPRPVLGLVFEQDLLARHAASLRLPPWFSNLLPEGRLRDWIAGDRGVKPVREMELLAHVGHDLPGAVRVVLDDRADDSVDADPQGAPGPRNADHDRFGTSGARAWRFSLAGVALKFSMLREGDRLTLPAGGIGGDWIVKLPDARYADVPRNEYAMMRLAGLAGIDVPDSGSSTATNWWGCRPSHGAGPRRGRTRCAASTGTSAASRCTSRTSRRCAMSIRSASTTATTKPSPRSSTDAVTCARCSSSRGGSPSRC